MTTVRSRFAPSPTGYLHIGGARTALFAYLYARQQQGTFILRIDDTDRQRSTQEYLDEIMDAMRWLGLAWDEGPYFQTQRDNLYQEAAERLLREGRAYRCYCTAEEVEAKRKAANITPLLCYAVSPSAAETIVDVAATLGVSRVILGAPQRSALINLLRGNVIREVSKSLPEEIDLLVYA